MVDTRVTIGAIENENYLSDDSRISFAGILPEYNLTALAESRISNASILLERNTFSLREVVTFYAIMVEYFFNPDTQVQWM